MTHEEDLADVFATPAYGKSSKWLDPADSRDISTFFTPNLGCIDGGTTLGHITKESNVQPEKAAPLELPLAHEGFFKLPAALSPKVAEDSPGVISSPCEKDLLSGAAVDGAADDGGDDVWLGFNEHSIPQPEPRLRTWAAFGSPDESFMPYLFVSETESSTYDDLYATSLAPPQPRGDAAGDGKGILDPKAYCASLLSLSLGQASVLFSWDEDKKTFVSNVPRARISGYSVEVLGRLSGLCLDCGNYMRFLEAFVNKAYSVRPTPTRVALANAIDKLLLSTKYELDKRGQEIKSVLQLQTTIYPVNTALAYFKRLVTDLSRARSDEELLSLLFEKAQSAEAGDILVRDATRGILSMVSRPWTDFVEEWIGLKAEEGIQLTKDGPGRSFVKVESRIVADNVGIELDEPDFFLAEENMPGFIPPDVALSIFEAGRNLRFLRHGHPDHPLAQGNLVSGREIPKFAWHFEWESLSGVEEKARAYERSLLEALREVSAEGDLRKCGESKTIAPGSGYELQYFGQKEDEMQRRLLASMKEMNQPAKDPAEADDLVKVIRGQLFGDHSTALPSANGFNPHWSLLPLLSFGPVVSAQSAVISRECMKLLFAAHDLRGHLKLQRDFQLLGNGVFCSRLSHALFDIEVETAERQAGVARAGESMGLRLGRRKNWPPASSELRLALMGVLSESYRGGSTNGPHPSHQPIRLDKQVLPGDLSFSVRELSEPEIEKCMDPDSIEALDFLRLSYKPPPPLRPIITPVILLKYDRIFKLLLRMLRMLHMSSQLFRDMTTRTSEWGDHDDASLRFVTESSHFVMTVTRYFFDTGIAMQWRKMDAWLDNCERELGIDYEKLLLRRDYSPDRLREHHENVLDQIMLALLLRKRQEPVLKLLEDIFGVILRFAKEVPRTATTQHDENAHGAKMRDLYRTFRKKVEVFITVCRGLSEKGSYGAKKTVEKGMMGYDQGRKDDSREENSIGQLVLMLDMSSYYTK